MRQIILAAALAAYATAAAAHHYRAGPLEIVHPAITVPAAGLDCTCAHLKIVNHGNRIEYLLGARIAAANFTHLIRSAGGKLLLPRRVAIAPGETLDLHRRDWCLFMSGITRALEADIGTVAGELLFESRAPIAVEFLIDAAAD